MKLQDAILKAMAKKISWLDAAEIIGVCDRTMRRMREGYQKFGYDGLRGAENFMGTRSERKRRDDTLNPHYKAGELTGSGAPVGISGFQRFEWPCRNAGLFHFETRVVRTWAGLCGFRDVGAVQQAGA